MPSDSRSSVGDQAAAVCHGVASEAQMRSLNELLRANPAARDEYLLRVELHARLASDTDLFASAAAQVAGTSLPGAADQGTLKILPLPTLARGRTRIVAWAAALAACLILLSALGLAIWLNRPVAKGTTSIAVAVLSCAVDAQWSRSTKAPAVGAALEPGWLRLKAGLAQVDFYSGARLVIQGPAELWLISPDEAFCPGGLVSAEVPPQALGFSVGTPQMTVVDLGTAFGLDVKRALEFRSVSDRVRFNVPGEFQALTVSAWVSVKGLDRQFNSLFMCDGFDRGKIHWQIRNDGVLDLGVQGPRVQDVQIFASPAAVGFNQFGQWMHLAVVVDGERRQVVHYVNGTAVSRHALSHPPPYRLGPTELGNWNPGEFPNKSPYQTKTL